MTGDELRAALSKLKLTHSEAARKFGLHPRTMRKYLAGVVAIPVLLALVIKFLLLHGLMP